MSEIEPAGDITAPNELQLMKDRARKLGIEFSNNIGLETLRAKVREKQAADEASDPDLIGAEPETNPLESKPTPMMSRRAKILAEQMRLVRVRITCMDPKKKDIPGEIITVANEYLGTVRKFVPFGEATDDGWHIPYCIYTFMESKRFQNIRTVKDKQKGVARVESNWAKEFAIEVLPPLTEGELKDLGRAQLAAG
jgi:hypothetical protein